MLGPSAFLEGLFYRSDDEKARALMSLKNVKIALPNRLPLDRRLLFLLNALSIEFYCTIRADAMCKLSLHLRADICFNFGPRSSIIANLLAMCTNRQEPSQCFNLFC